MSYYVILCQVMSYCHEKIFFPTEWESGKMGKFLVFPLRVGKQVIAQ